MVLFAGVGTVIALLIAARLYPGKTAQLAFPGTTNDRFAPFWKKRTPRSTSRKSPGSAGNTTARTSKSVPRRCRDVSRRRESPAAGRPGRERRPRVAAPPRCLAAQFPLYPRDGALGPLRRVDREHAARRRPDDADSRAGDDRPRQMPLHYAATPEDAARAAAELVNPWSVEPIDAEARTAAETARPKTVYDLLPPLPRRRSAGDGPVSARGYPPPPSFGLDNARNMADGQMFHILTYGQKNMPGYAGQVAAEDRWKVILHVRALQVAFRQQIAEQKAKAEGSPSGSSCSRSSISPSATRFPRPSVLAASSWARSRRPTRGNNCWRPSSTRAK